MNKPQCQNLYPQADLSWCAGTDRDLPGSQPLWECCQNPSPRCTHPTPPDHPPWNTLPCGHSGSHHQQRPPTGLASPQPLPQKWYLLPQCHPSIHLCGNLCRQLPRCHQLSRDGTGRINILWIPDCVVLADRWWGGHVCSGHDSRQCDSGQAATNRCTRYVISQPPSKSSHILADSEGFQMLWARNINLIRAKTFRCWVCSRQEDSGGSPAKNTSSLVHIFKLLCQPCHYLQ